MAFSINFELNSSQNKHGLYSILLRVTKNRKSSRLATNLFIEHSHFNKKGRFGKWIRNSDLRHAYINNQLVTKYNDLQVFCANHEESKPNCTSKELVAAYKMNKSSIGGVTWIKYLEKTYDKYIGLDKIRYAYKLRAVKNKLEDMWDGADPDMQETTLSLAEDFDAYMIRIGNNPNTRNINLKHLQHVYRLAIEEDLIQAPDIKFLNYKTKGIAASRAKLTSEEIERLENVALTKLTWPWHARNYFLFAFYMGGIRFGDFIELKWSDIDQGVLNYTMNKTGKQQRLKLISKAQKILEMYRPFRISTEDFIFPLLKADYWALDKQSKIKAVSSKNVLVNTNLKKVAKVAQIDKRLTFHVARHSFAYIAFKKTKNSLAVQRMLQHSKLAETEKYIDSLANDQADLLDEVFD